MHTRLSGSSFLASPHARACDQARADTQKIQQRFDAAIAEAQSTAALEVALTSPLHSVPISSEQLEAVDPRESSSRYARHGLVDKFDSALAETRADLPCALSAQLPVAPMHGDPMDVSNSDIDEGSPAVRHDTGVTAGVQKADGAITNFSTASSSKGSTHTSDTLPSSTRADEQRQRPVATGPHALSQPSPLPVALPPRTEASAKLGHISPGQPQRTSQFAGRRSVGCPC